MGKIRKRPEGIQKKVQGLWSFTEEQKQQQAAAAAQPYNILLDCAKIPKGSSIRIRVMCAPNQFTKKLSLGIPPEISGRDRWRVIVFDPTQEDEVMALPLPKGKPVRSLITDRNNVRPRFRFPIIRWQKVETEDGSGTWIANPHCFAAASRLAYALKSQLDMSASVPEADHVIKYFASMEEPGRDFMVISIDQGDMPQWYQLENCETHVRITDERLERFLAAKERIEELWFESYSISQIKAVIAGEEEEEEEEDNDLIPDDDYSVDAKSSDDDSGGADVDMIDPYIDE